MLYMSLLLFLTTISATEIDPHGYMIFCPCMGRFGNQVDQTLGAIQFARSLDRTLVLPNFIEFNHPKTDFIPFEHLFQLNVIKQFLRVVTMSDFVKNIMPQVWPADQRRALCWSPRKSIFDETMEPSCNAKEGNPFGPYWDKIGVDFVGDDYFGDIPGGYEMSAAGSRKAWFGKFNATAYPVLAFTSAPGAFPSRKRDWDVQRYMKWGPRVLGKAKTFISETLTRPFIGIHLRNNRDWDNVCEHINPDKKTPLFASAQCLGEMHHVASLTKEICKPSVETVVEDVVTEVGRLGAKSVFVTSDHDHMLPEINDALAPYDVKAYRLPTEDSYVALAVLGQADHFIGNCVSTFSHIVKRDRDTSKMVSQDPSVAALLKKYDVFDSAEFNKIRCRLTGHELPQKVKPIQEYIETKKFKTAWEIHQILEAHPNVFEELDEKLLGCKITKKVIAKDPVDLKRHLEGKKFKKAVARGITGEEEEDEAEDPVNEMMESEEPSDDEEDDEDDDDDEEMDDEPEEVEDQKEYPELSKNGKRSHEDDSYDFKAMDIEKPSAKKKKRTAK